MVADNRRVMIACVTFETVKVTEPVFTFACNRVHLIHYSDKRDSVYSKFYARVVEMLKSGNNRIEIVEHNAKVYEFDTMLRTVLNIIEAEDGAQSIHINVSAGSPEYSAASAIGSMMYRDRTRLISVRAKKYMVGDEKAIMETYFKDGQPVGLTEEVGEMDSVKQYHIQMPERKLVLGLRIMDSLQKTGQKTSAKFLIPAFRDAGIWIRPDNEPKIEQGNMCRPTHDKIKSDKVKNQNIDAVYFSRGFTQKWLEYGWVSKAEGRNALDITPEGREVISMFYLDERL